MLTRLIDCLVTAGSMGAIMATNSSGMESLPKLITEYGLAISLVLYFVYRDQNREGRMARRIDELEKYQQNELTKRVEMSAAAMDKTADSVDKLTTQIVSMHEDQRDMILEMAKRPCLLDNNSGKGKA